MQTSSPVEFEQAHWDRKDSWEATQDKGNLERMHMHKQGYTAAHTSIKCGHQFAALTAETKRSIEIHNIQKIESLNIAKFQLKYFKCQCIEY